MFLIEENFLFKISTPATHLSKSKYKSSEYRVCIIYIYPIIWFVSSKSWQIFYSSCQHITIVTGTLLYKVPEAGTENIFISKHMILINIRFTSIQPAARFHYPLSEPIITPFTKCFWIKGYRTSTGRLDMMIREYFINSAALCLRWISSIDKLL